MSNQRVTDRSHGLVNKLHELGAGHGGDEITSILRAGQAGKRRLLVLAVVRAYRHGHGAADIAEALKLFEAVERIAPRAAERILTHPMVDAWATACLRDSGAPDLGYLSAMAAAAAVRAGIPFEISIPCPRGVIVLPTLGGAHDLGGGAAVVSGDIDGAEIAGPRGLPVGLGDSPRWTPIRRITIGPPNNLLSLDIEDLDPYRAGYPWPPTSRLPPVRAQRLTELIVEAWDWIVTHCPRHAPALAGLLRSIVPVAVPENRHQVSATAPTLWGAIAVSEPYDADTLALLMIHEAQHGKLDAVMDLVDLHVSNGPARYRAPWRLDPRPIGALLHGAYAHLGVADVWRTRRVRPWGGSPAMAAFEFGYWRAQTSRAVRTLRESGELTPLGSDFVAAMEETLQAWKREPLPSGVATAVHDVDRAGAVHWRLRNVLADQDHVARLAKDWRAGGDAVVPPPAPPRPGPPCPADLGGLPAEIARRASLVGSPAAVSAGGGADLTPADRAFLTADYTEAAIGYRRQLAEAPGDDRAWVGLLLALSRIASDASEVGVAVRGLLTMPELVKAVYAALVGASGPTPDSVAAWLAGYQRVDRVQSGGGSM